MRRGIIRRLIGIIVAFSMLFGMVGFAETGVRVEAKLDSPFAAFDGAVSTYLDLDFCNVILLEEASLGEILIQAGETLVFGNSETGYTQITEEAFGEALMILLLAIENELPMEEALRLYRYETSAGYAEDVALFSQFLEQSLNQLAFIMMQKGAIIIYENGDMELTITPENYQEIMLALTDQIYGDEETMEMLSSLNVWEAMGVSAEEALARPEPESLPEILSGFFAHEIEDVHLHAYLSATGMLNVKASVSEADTGLTKELVIYVDVTGMGFHYTSKKEGFERACKAYFIDNQLTIDAWQSGGADNSYALNVLIGEDGSTKASGTMSMNGKKGAFEYEMTPMALDFDAELTTDTYHLLVRYEAEPFAGGEEMFVSFEKGENYEEFYVSAESDTFARLSYVHKIGGAVENELSLINTGEDPVEIKAAWGGEDGKNAEAKLNQVILYDTETDDYGLNILLEGTVTAKGEEGYTRDFALNVDELHRTMLFVYETEGSAEYTDSLTLSLVENEDDRVGTIQYHCQKKEDGILKTTDAVGKVFVKPGEIGAEIKLENAADGNRNAPVEWKMYSSADKATISCSNEAGTLISSVEIYEEDGKRILKGKARRIFADGTEADVITCSAEKNLADGDSKAEIHAPLLGIEQMVLQKTKDAYHVFVKTADSSAVIDLTAAVVYEENKIGVKLEGTLNGQKIHGDIGLEGRGEGLWTGYAGLTVDEVENAVEIPVSIQAQGDTVTVTAQLKLLAEEMFVSLGEINASYAEREYESEFAFTLDVFDGAALSRYLDFTLKAEILDGEYAHVTGENLSGEQLAQILFDLLGLPEAF